MRDLNKKSNRLKNDKILNSALELVAEKGYENTTMEQIAETAGLTKMTLYAYYESKEAIFFEILIAGINKRLEPVKEALQKPVSGKEIVYECGMKYLDFFLKYPGYLKLSLYMDYSSGAVYLKNDAYQRRTSEIGQYAIEQLVTVFKRGIADGSFSPDIVFPDTAYFFSITMRSIANRVVFGGMSRSFYVNYLESFIKSISR